MKSYQNCAVRVVSCLIFTAISMYAVPVAAQQSDQQTSQPEVSSSQPNRRPDTGQNPETGVEGTKGTRVFGIMPNNLTVEGASKITPISTREKFSLVAEARSIYMNSAP
jgi:hypothetical protein